MAMEAYVLINVDMGKTMEVLEALAKLEGVTSAHSVTGPYDIVVAIGVTNLDRLGSLMSDVHSIYGIERTTTCIAVALTKKRKALSRWETLRAELMKRKEANEPVKTLVQGLPNWIEEVGEDYVVVRSERTDTPRKYSKVVIESRSGPGNRIIAALRRLGGYQ